MPKLNFTNKKKLSNELFDLEFFEVTNGCEVSLKWDINKFPKFKDARVILKCYKTGDVDQLRMDWGTVNNRNQPVDCIIDKDTGAYRFNITFVDNNKSKGKILAETSDFTLGSSLFGRTSLLPMSFREDLGGNIWEVDFSGNDPVLHIQSINNTYNDNLLRENFFFALVYPQAIKTIFTKILVIDRTEVSLDDIKSGEEWYQKWLRWALSNNYLLEEKYDSLDFESRDSDELLEVVNEIVCVFSNEINAVEKLRTYSE